MQTITITKKAALGIAAAFGGLFVLGVAGGAWASHSFSDVPDDHTFHDSIGYVAQAGIAGGFGDGTYRPSQGVTRGQMAAFIHRASGNHPSVPRSVDAAELGGKTAAEWQAEIDALKDKLQFVSIVGGNTMRISGANLQVVSGTNATGGTLNGLGNLIVGYNESSGDTRTGSHNLVVGVGHSYSSYGGIVGGANNVISGTFASVTGGQGNTASNTYSTVTGGLSNTASNYAAAVTGGFFNTASGSYSTVSGGASRSVTEIDDWRGGSYFSEN